MTHEPIYFLNRKYLVATANRYFSTDITYFTDQAALLLCSVWFFYFCYIFAASLNGYRDSEFTKTNGY
jgi:hypothetical protein